MFSELGSPKDDYRHIENFSLSVYNPNQPPLLQHTVDNVLA